jgi:glycyl-tRNA synthetase
VPSAGGYADAIRAAGIVLDGEERKRSILEQVRQAAALVGGEVVMDEALLGEVTNLVEMPTAVMGGFNRDFLALPQDVLVSVMKKHQRYFPVRKDGKLLPHFIAIRNGDDLQWTWSQERARPGARCRCRFLRPRGPEEAVEALRRCSTLIFQTKLGSMLTSPERITGW